MANLIRLTDYCSDDVYSIFKITDQLHDGKYQDILKGKTIVMFFPDSSIRTRVTFERGIHLLGGQTIIFPPATLDKKESLKDVCGYLDNWIDMIIVRHPNIEVIEQLAQYAKVPVINAMSDINHPCEVISDMYVLSKIRNDFTKDNYLFCGENGNIGLAWKEAAQVMGLKLEQCCPKGYEMPEVVTLNNLLEAIIDKDIICCDSLPSDSLAEFKDFIITSKIMDMANQGALLNPCPPIYRDEGVSSEVIDSKYFVGYKFKSCLLEVQQAIIIYCLNS